MMKNTTRHISPISTRYAKRGLKALLSMVLSVVMTASVSIVMTSCSADEPDDIISNKTTRTAFYDVNQCEVYLNGRKVDSVKECSIDVQSSATSSSMLKSADNDEPYYAVVRIKGFPTASENADFGVYMNGETFSGVLHMNSNTYNVTGVKEPIGIDTERIVVNFSSSGKVFAH